MHYDPDLADRLGSLSTEAFDGEVFRATRPSVDPTAPSLYGGRWGRPQNDEPGTSVLYTSLARDGAIAEVVFFLSEQTPMPGSRNLKITRMAVTTSKTLRLVHADFSKFGIDPARYGERDYARTQEIGSTLAWLGLDGLIAPSARWKCDNLVLFTEKHALSEKLDPIDEELIEWRAWAKEHGMIPPDS